MEYMDRIHHLVHNQIQHKKQYIYIYIQVLQQKHQQITMTQFDKEFSDTLQCWNWWDLEEGIIYVPVAPTLVGKKTITLQKRSL